MVIFIKERYIRYSRPEMPVVCFGGYDRNLSPGITYGPVTRDIYIIECNTSGYGSVIINGREFPVRPGDCYILLPGDTVTHTTSRSEPRGGVWCALDGMQVGRVLEQVGITSTSPYAPPELFDALTKELSFIVDMQNDHDPGAELRRTGHLCSLLGILLSTSSSSMRTDWLTQVLGYIETYYNTPITVDNLAKTAFLERSYFSVRFKEKMGMSPHAYLNSLRIRKACELMRKTNCNVSDVAALVGLDSRNFSRIFKREMNITPREYLKFNIKE